MYKTNAKKVNYNCVAMALDETNQFFHLSRSQKLLTSENYSFVFSKSQRFGNKSFTVLARKNDLGHPRLGLAISKKCAKRAVDRNRIKRIFRESFRLHQHNLPNVDIIAMCKSDVLQLDKKEMHKQIEKQWRFMQKKFLTSTTD